MKIISIALFAGLLYQNISFASEYRQYNASLLSTSGEVKTFIVKVDPSLRIDTYGEPEIPNHGFNNYMVTGTVLENDSECDFELLLAQASGEELSADEILKKGADRSGSLKLCSGLRVSLASVRNLVVTPEKNLSIHLYASGLSQAIGGGSLSFIGIIETIQPSYED